MPRWNYEVRLGDVWKNESMSFEQRRDAIVQRLLASTWAAAYLDVEGLAGDLLAAADESDFDETWEAVYDLADETRAWIDLWSPVGAS